MQLPMPYPDELAGSVWARASVRYGLPIATVIKSTLGERKKAVSFLMGQDINRVSSAMGVAPEVYLSAHTIFPYAVAFMPLDYQMALREKFLRTSRMSSCIGSITKVVTHGVLERRFCPICVASDLITYGETYWHRQHHLPGILICTSHQCRVLSTNIPLNGKVVPLDGCLPPLSTGAQSVELSDEILQYIAELSHAALAGEVPASRTTSEYRATAGAMGYTLTRTELASAVFTREFARFFGASYLRRAGCEIRGRPACHWPALMLRQNVGLYFAAPKHILMHAFLRHTTKVDISELKSYKSPGPQLPDFTRVDRQLVAKLSEIAVQMELNGDRSTVKAIMTKAEAWQSFRHHRESYPLTSQFLENFRRSELAERQIGGRVVWRVRFPKRFGSKVPNAR